MTSGTFFSCPIDQIVVPEERQRHDFEDKEGLLDSIRRLGLIHPIVVTREYVLVSGERRLRACRNLGWDNVSVQFTDVQDQWSLKTIELEENIKRKNLHWLEESRAINELDRLYHERASENIQSWTDADTAEVAGLSRTMIIAHKEAIAAVESNPELANENTRSAVLTVYRNKTQREQDSPIYGPNVTHCQKDHILNCSFLDWVKNYSGPKFNLIHCDFPYGIDFNKMGSQAGTSLGRYKDDFEGYRNMLATLLNVVDIFTENSAHILFWFSMQYFGFTKEMFEQVEGLSINPFPLIWVKSDHSGILPDPTRGPRRIYETAFLITRGDRRIVRAKSNAFVGLPTKLIHPHEKPQEMLEYFFEMLVDETTSLFDPTCGGGSALRAAKKLGAQRVLGLEINEEYARQANNKFNRLTIDEVGILEGLYPDE